MEIPEQRVQAETPKAGTNGPTKIRVHDQHQVLEFEGEQIGFASTETPDTVRWTEIELYRTTAGNYVIHRVGASVVYHDAAASCASGSLTTAGRLQSEDPDADHEPCERCRPPRIEKMDPKRPIRREADRHSADAVTSVEDLVKKLLLQRPNGTSYLSAVARDALTQAAHTDPAIAKMTGQTVYIP
jgi:hypothetical protein